MSDKVTRMHVPAPTSGHGGGDTALVENFLRLIEGKTDCSVAPLSSGIESAKICLAAKASSETNQFYNV